jgi:hypothetical protein
MNVFLWAVGGVTVVLCGLMSYFVTRRYGWGAALALPLAALAALIGMIWQERGLTLAEGMGLLRETLVFAAPILIGALVGIAIAWRWRA